LLDPLAVSAPRCPSTIATQPAGTLFVDGGGHVCGFF